MWPYLSIIINSWLYPIFLLVWDLWIKMVLQRTNTLLGINVNRYCIDDITVVWVTIGTYTIIKIPNESIHVVFQNNHQFLGTVVTVLVIKMITKWEHWTVWVKQGDIWFIIWILMMFLLLALQFIVNCVTKWLSDKSLDCSMSDRQLLFT